MALTFVGTRLPEAELTRDGRLLFVRVDLPEASIEAVVSIVTHERVGEEGKRRWSIGVSIHQMTDADTAELETYLARRAKGHCSFRSDRQLDQGSDSRIPELFKLRGG